METPRINFHNVLTKILFPFILVSNILLLIFAVSSRLDLAMSFNILLIGNLVVLFVLEKVLMFRSNWNINLKEFFRDFGYFGFNGLMDTGVKLILGFIVINYSSPTRSIPFWISVMIAILIVEFFGYWYHRLGHENHFLWKIHSIHHVPDKVNLLNNNTANFLNIVFGTTVKLLPLILLDFDQQSVFIAVSLTTIHSYVVHMNADVRGGWLNQIFLSPEHHRFHHSTVIHEAKNFGVLLTLWDKVFGTYFLNEGMTPEIVGVANPDDYPKPFQVVRGFLFPFTKKRLW